jgi:aspartyl-tRNA(Asn)/glutamyl-tRNA(Gln) amidotransferase subunit C
MQLPRQKYGIISHQNEVIPKKYKQMSISLDEVGRIAKLARLKFTDDEKQKLQTELSAILAYVDQLKQIEGKAPVIDLSQDDGINLMRDDVAEVTTEPEEFLKQAPAREGGFIKVKSVME